MKSNKIIKLTSLKPLNESVEPGSSNKYKFSGVFTACSTPGHTVINRNNRSYPEKEVLKHLSYLRNTIKEQGSILGELDHPEGRFDILLKQASHKITDLWYDLNTHCVMGKLELLDTPNGKIALELVESGYPLFVSSRAAGDVDEKTHEVEIMQIFTYDIVCTPGFSEAKLERVNESLNLSKATMKYLNESASFYKGSNTAVIDYLNESEKNKVNEKINTIMSKQYNINMKDLTTPILNEDEDTNTDNSENKSDDKKDNSGSDFSLPDMSLDPSTESSSSDEKKDDNTETNTDSDKEEKKKKIISIQGEDEDGNILSDKDDEDKEEKKSKILSIETEESDEESDSDNDDNTEEEAEKKEKDDEEVKEQKKLKDKISEKTEEDIEKYEALLDEVAKTEAVKESIVKRYPFSISLSEANFAKFAALRPKQKKKCSDFIEENLIYDIKAINELWSTPLRAEKRVQENWLKLASQSDLDLYVKAPLEIQNAIEESAKYVILETKEEVDEFWRKTGLRLQEALRRMNEEFVNNYKLNVVQNGKLKNELSSASLLGYNMDFIKMTEDYFDMI